jgi:Fur family transcriptional regulator, zinc uptake regulator
MKKNDASSLAGRRVLRDNDRRVLDALEAARGPLRAYELLDILRREGINGPPTVYRALERLCRKGLVHRVESMNAYIACHHPDHTEPPILVICEECGHIDELHDAAVVARLQRDASTRGLERVTVYLEVRGRCRRCSACAPAARSRGGDDGREGGKARAGREPTSVRERRR